MSRFSLLKVSFALLVGILLMLFGQSLFAAQSTLTWDAVSNSSLQGYKVYYGTASRNYTTSIDVKNVTSYQVTGLSDGTTYYFAVTAYSSNAESAFSAEVTYTAPAGTTTSAPPSCTFSLSSSSASFGSSGGAGNVTVNAPAGCAWSFSTPPSWLTLALGTGNGSVMYTVAPNNNTTSRTANLTIAGRAFTVTQSGLTQYTITASAATGGSITPSGSITVIQGGGQPFAIAPSPGYAIANVKADGVSQGAVTSYAFTNVSANHTIAARFAASTYTLSTTKTGTGTGAVTNSPSGTTFTRGTQVTLTATPDAGSTFTGWSGACSGASPTCTVTMNGPTNVTASFATKSYAIAAAAGTGGSLSPSGLVNVNQGASQGFTVSADSGYTIAYVKVDGASVGAVTSYNFSNVTANHTIAATFAATTYNLSVSTAGTGTGAVTSSLSGTTFTQGTQVTLTAAAHSSSTFTGWSGACSGTSSTCTVTMNGNISLTASFAAKSYNITASAGIGGSISPLSSVNVIQGTSQTFVIAANSGYTISNVKVDGVSQGAVSSYTFSNVTTNHTIAASFR